MITTTCWYLAGGKPWSGLLDRGMAVDFDWVTGSAPQYVAAYGRAAAIQLGRRPPVVLPYSVN